MNNILDKLQGFLPGSLESVQSYVFSLAITAFITYLVLLIIGFSLNFFINRAQVLQDKRGETIKSIYKNTSNYILAAIVLIAAIKPFFADLSELILAGGIIAAVIGFGAQKVVNDILSGIFMVFEGTIKAGDFIHINEELEGGTVEEIGFRIIKIRLINGKLVTVSNGEIRKMVNGSVHKRRIFESVIFSFNENPLKVKELLQNVCNELNNKHTNYLKKNSDGSFEEEYKVYGFHSLDTSLNGYKISIVGTVNDTDYLSAVLEAKELMAQKLYENKIKMAETYIHQN